MDTTMVNSKTGEVFEVLVPDVPFRTIQTAGEYKDGESYVEGSSITDLNGYEPLESIIARCTRQVVGINGRGLQVIDMRALKEESQGVMTQYDVEGLTEHSTPEQVQQAFEQAYDPTVSNGFDKLQAMDILSSVNDNSEDLPTSKEPAQDPSIVQAQDPAVDKSDAEGSDDNEKSKQATA